MECQRSEFPLIRHVKRTIEAYNKISSETGREPLSDNKGKIIRKVRFSVLKRGQI